MRLYVDVHILTIPEQNAEWFETCLRSLDNEPVNIHICSGIKNDIGNARANAFLQGDSEYVSFVDPDDYVLPGGFAACLKALQDEQSAGAYTAEINTGISGEVTKCPFIRDWIHHLIVLRRSLVLQHLNVWREWRWPCKFSEGKVFVDFLQSQGHSISRIPEPYYVWRRNYLSYTVRNRHGLG